MALKPEFISLLRDIRDRIYSRLVTIDRNVSDYNTNIEEIHNKIIVIDSGIEQKYSTLLNIAVGSVDTVELNPDGSHGTAVVVYTPLTNLFDFGIPTGEKGTTGAQGTKGDSGNQGIKGDIGQTGQTGDQGVQGIQGTTGATGSTGQVGAEGLVGPQGPSGTGIEILGRNTVANILALPSTTPSEAWISTDTGLDEDGISVVTGDVLRATGSKWINVGPIEGPQGVQGVQGIAGTPGNTGATGIQGAQGIQGTVGDKGNTGDQGIQGIQGIQGVIGIQGPTGLKGNTGNDGESYRVKGSDTYDIIVADATRLSGDIWITTTDDAGSGTIIGDGIHWNGTTNTNIGQLRGQTGVVDYASQSEVDAGIITNKALNPKTFTDSQQLIDINNSISTNATAITKKLTSNATGITGATALANSVTLSQASYDAIVTKEPSTLYYIPKV